MSVKIEYQKDAIVAKVKKCDYPDMGLGKIIASGKPYEQRPKGEWISHKNERRKTCSECGVDWKNVEEFDYCPKCGADMRGEEE